MHTSIFTHFNFWLLLFFSFATPFAIYMLLLMKRSISRASVLLFAIVLVLVSGVDVFLLKLVTAHAKVTPSLFDDAIFFSEVSLALYILPITFGGIGVNLISHILLTHLTGAERLFKKEHERA